MGCADRQPGRPVRNCELVPVTTTDNAAQPEHITEADFDTVPLTGLADLIGRYLTQEFTPHDAPEPTP